MALTKPSTKDSVDPPAVPLACGVCRERHLKCDGLTPSCSRCLDSKQKCFYVQSRRGHRPARKRQRSDESTEIPDAQGEALESANGININATAYLQNGSIDPRAVARMAQPTPPRLSVITGVGRSKLRELYYYYFHNAHPIMLPQAYLSQVPASATPPAVNAVMDYIGAQFSNQASIDPNYLRNLQASLYSRDSTRDGYTVQALLLLGIVQRAHDQTDLAYATFNEAIDLALHLGMNRATFALVNSQGSLIVQEMWRRVWWELYVNDLLLAGYRHDTYSRMYAAETDIELPWEEGNYGSCTPTVSYSMKDFDQSTFFADEDIAFSSFAYRIIAARAIGRLLKLNQPFCPDSSELVIAVDLSVNNWFLHLPEEKKTPLGKDGRLDEMMFQAHMTTNSTSICLHRPRSDLVFTAVPDSTSCTPSRVYGVPANKFSVHTAKCIQAADRMADLITLPGNVLQHTPLFTCMLTLSSVVHLSAYVLSHSTDQRAFIRERLALSVGSLKGIKSTWVLADGVLQNIKAAAKEVMECGMRMEAPMVQAGDLYGAGVGSDNPWVVTMQDPLFKEVPELMPIEQVQSMSLPIPLQDHSSVTSVGVSFG